MDANQYLEIFINEASEYLQNFKDCLEALEKQPGSRRILMELSRIVHSLKGMAETMGFYRIKHLSCSVENVFIRVQDGTGKVTGQMIDLLFEFIDAVDKYIEHIRRTSKEGAEENEALRKALDELVFTSEQTPKMAVVSVTEEEKESKETFKRFRNAASKEKFHKKTTTARTVRVDMEKLDELMSEVSELIILKNSFAVMQISKETVFDLPSLRERIESLERITANLHESVMQVRMVPLEYTINKFPRMVRDLARKQNKRIELYISGENMELDRTVADQIVLPLWHLIRNAVEWGIEDRTVRWQRNKHEKGAIYLNAYQQDENMMIRVRDDGNGISSQKIKEKAIASGRLTSALADSMSEKEIYQLLLESDGSNRNRGLSIVRSAVEALGGDMEFTTEPGGGSEFVIRIPLTLAIIQAMVVGIRQEKYMIALNAVISIEDVLADEIISAGSEKMIYFNDRKMPLIYVDEMIDAAPYEKERKSLKVVFVKKGEKYAGLVVDDLIGQQEIVVKPLGRFIKAGKMISGASILGDGTAALILDVNALIS